MSKPMVIDPAHNEILIAAEVGSGQSLVHLVLRLSRETAQSFCDLYHAWQALGNKAEKTLTISAEPWAFIPCILSDVGSLGTSAFRQIKAPVQARCLTSLSNKYEISELGVKLSACPSGMGDDTRNVSAVLAWREIDKFIKDGTFTTLAPVEAPAANNKEFRVLFVRDSRIVQCHCGFGSEVDAETFFHSLADADGSIPLDLQDTGAFVVGPDVIKPLQWRHDNKTFYYKSVTGLILAADVRARGRKQADAVLLQLCSQDPVVITLAHGVTLGVRFDKALFDLVSPLS
jgi:hypothetical protein